MEDLNVIFGGGSNELLPHHHHFGDELLLKVRRSNELLLRHPHDIINTSPGIQKPQPTTNASSKFPLGASCPLSIIILNEKLPDRILRYNGENNMGLVVVSRHLTNAKAHESGGDSGGGGKNNVLNWLDKLNFLSTALQSIVKKEALNFKDVDDAIRKLFDEKKGGNGGTGRYYVYFLDEVTMLPVMSLPAAVNEQNSSSSSAERGGGANHTSSSSSSSGVHSGSGGRPQYRYPIEIDSSSSDREILPRLLVLMKLTLKAIADARGVAGVLRCLGFSDTIVPKSVYDKVVNLVGVLSADIAASEFLALSNYTKKFRFSNHRPHGGDEEQGAVTAPEEKEEEKMIHANDDAAATAMIDYEQLFGTPADNNSPVSDAAAAAARGETPAAGGDSSSEPSDDLQLVSTRTARAATAAAANSTKLVLDAQMASVLGDFYQFLSRRCDDVGADSIQQSYGGLQLLVSKENYYCWTSKRRAEVIKSRGIRELKNREKISLYGQRAAAGSSAASLLLEGAVLSNLSTVATAVFDTSRKQAAASVVNSTGITVSGCRRSGGGERRRTVATFVPLLLSSVLASSAMTNTTAAEEGFAKKTDSKNDDEKQQQVEEGGMIVSTTNTHTAPEKKPSSSSSRKSSSREEIREEETRNHPRGGGGGKKGGGGPGESSSIATTTSSANPASAADSKEGGGGGAARSSQRKMSSLPAGGGVSSEAAEEPQEKKERSQKHQEGEQQQAKNGALKLVGKMSIDLRLQSPGVAADDSTTTSKSPIFRAATASVKSLFSGSGSQTRVHPSPTRDDAAAASSSGTSSATSDEGSAAVVPPPNGAAAAEDGKSTGAAGGGSGSGSSGSTCSSGGGGGGGGGGIGSGGEQGGKSKLAAVGEEEGEGNNEDNDDSSSDRDSDLDPCVFTKGDLRELLDAQTTLLRMCISDLKRYGQRGNGDMMSALKVLRADMARLNANVTTMNIETAAAAVARGSETNLGSNTGAVAVPPLSNQTSTDTLGVSRQQSVVSVLGSTIAPSTVGLSMIEPLSSTHSGGSIHEMTPLLSSPAARVTAGKKRHLQHHHNKRTSYQSSSSNNIHRSSQHVGGDLLPPEIRLHNPHSTQIGRMESRSAGPRSEFKTNTVHGAEAMDEVYDNYTRPADRSTVIHTAGVLANESNARNTVPNDDAGGRRGAPSRDRGRRGSRGNCSIM